MNKDLERETILREYHEAKAEITQEYEIQERLIFRTLLDQLESLKKYHYANKAFVGSKSSGALGCKTQKTQGDQVYNQDVLEGGPYLRYMPPCDDYLDQAGAKDSGYR